MKKRKKRLWNLFLGAAVGVFIGHSIGVWLDYKSNPGLYMVQSAPWYTSILLYGGMTFVLLMIAAICKLIEKRKSGK